MESNDPDQNLREIAEWLQQTGGFWGTFGTLEPLMAWLRQGGRCAYCDKDLVVEERMINGRCSTDHLLPARRYPQLDWKSDRIDCKDFRNAVTACRDCNGLKGSWDPNTSIDPQVFRPDTDDRLTEAMQQTLATIYFANQTW